MKRFACGDIIPGCDAVFTAADEEAIFALAAPHAAEAHGMTADQITPDVMDRFRAAMVTV